MLKAYGNKFCSNHCDSKSASLKEHDSKVKEKQTNEKIIYYNEKEVVETIEKWIGRCIGRY